MREKVRFVTQTSGLMCSHYNLNNINSHKLIRVDIYYNQKSNTYLLKAVSGRNLSRICKIPTVELTNDEYKSLVSDYDPYNDLETFTLPIMRLCNLSV